MIPIARPQMGEEEKERVWEAMSSGSLAQGPRVKQLEDSGVIARYVALVDPRAVGQPGTSYTIVNLERLTTPAIEAFERAVQAEPSILDCFYVAGTNDYLIRFTYNDAADLERFHTDVLMRLPGVLRSNSMLVLRTVKKTTALDV